MGVNDEKKKNCELQKIESTTKPFFRHAATFCAHTTYMGSLAAPMPNALRAPAGRVMSAATERDGGKKGRVDSMPLLLFPLVVPPRLFRPGAPINAAV